MDDFLERINALCRVVDINFSELFMRNSFQHTSELLNSDDFQELSESEYAVEVKLSNLDRPTISLRALGQARLPNSTLSKYRKQLSGVVVNDFKIEEAHLLKFMYGLGERLDKMLQGRAAREKSIEILLGI